MRVKPSRLINNMEQNTYLVFFAAPASQSAAELQRRYFINGPSNEHAHSSGFSLDYFLGQNWKHSHMMEHVMVSPANKIRPVRSYLLPVRTDTFQLSRMYGLGAREFCPVENEVQYSSAGHQQRNADGKTKVRILRRRSLLETVWYSKNMRAWHSRFFQSRKS